MREVDWISARGGVDISTGDLKGVSWPIDLSKSASYIYILSDICMYIYDVDMFTRDGRYESNEG